MSDLDDKMRALRLSVSEERVIPNGMHEKLGQAFGASAPSVTWSPQALANLECARRKFAFWARWHPLPSRREKNRQALAILDGLSQGIAVSSFYEQALEYGRKYAAQAKKK